MPQLTGLRQLRESRGETQQDLADSVGLTKGAISHFESGLFQPSLDTAIKLADHYGVAIDRLFYAVAGSRK